MAGERTVCAPRRAQDDFDRAIAGLAERQHGVVSRAQLTALGLGRKAIDHRLRRRRLILLHRGVYAVGHGALPVHAGAMAAVLLGGDGAVLSHRSAAELWRLRPPEHTAFEVTAARRRRSHGRVRFHRIALPPDEVTVERKVPVTTVPRTILDLAAVAARRHVERALHEAEVQRLTDPLSLADLLARHPRHRGVATIRAILEEEAIGLTVTRSELEERFLAFLDRAGLPRPLTNVPVSAGGRLIEVDCVWPAQRLIVELDGHATHATRRAYERDRVNDRALNAERWRVVRVTWRELHAAPRELEADLRAILHGALT